MPKISIRANTLYYRDPEHTEVVGVVDGQGTLWLKDIPNGETLWNEGRYEGLRSEVVRSTGRRWAWEVSFRRAREVGER